MRLKFFDRLRMSGMVKYRDCHVPISAGLAMAGRAPIVTSMISKYNFGIPIVVVAARQV
jgi:hypothetical protein